MALPRRAEAHFKDAARRAAFAVAVPEAVNPRRRRAAFVNELDPKLDVPRRHVRGALHRSVKGQFDNGIHLPRGGFLRRFAVADSISRFSS